MTIFTIMIPAFKNEFNNCLNISDLLSSEELSSLFAPLSPPPIIFKSVEVILIINNIYENKTKVKKLIVNIIFNVISILIFVIIINILL